ncbi:MAG: extracellular solute-binding protein [Candidatus Krumholzibacteriota bacterium]|nr:extracellular solute-binding protein [Candidatus Krumholzibacteriota bacterium]
MILLSMIVILSSCAKKGEEKPQELIIFHAGSLSVPFKKAAEAYKTEHPGVKILMEAAGSRTCARKISDLGRPCDVMASADYSVINTLLIPDHASWNIRFASNEMVVTYHEGSEGSDGIDSKNWLDILLDSGTAYGRSDPDSDPCGYRTVLTAKLAERYYGREGFADSLLAKDQRYIRPKETDLLALLESSAIDYLFIYRSVASQHGLKYLILPDEINLKEPFLAEYYDSVSVEISGKEPGTRVVKRGAPMVYGVTVPHNAPNRELALSFVEFLLDAEKGLAIMEECGQPPVVPSVSESYDSLPDRLKRFALEPLL